MTRHETRFATDGELLVIRGRLTGPLGTSIGRFVLDTGAVFTTLTPELADLVGYSARDATRRTRVRTAIGSEEGYLLEVANLAVLGLARSRFPVHVFDLGHDDIDGLLGLNFLSELNYEIRSAERRILVEAIDRAAPARL
ncbi:MAG TPA: retropepsin-like aspartic protease [Kofleriaceae bacterium]|nr:retropepsin-like aspartic protease [Kofleriaceae bacterium]